MTIDTSRTAPFPVPGSHGMFYVATLISSPGHPAVTDALAQKVARYLPHGRPVDWLAPGVATDIAFLGEEFEGASAGDADRLRKDLAQDIRDIVGSEPVDVVIQPQEGRRKKLFLADMDSTMIGQECIDELADYAGFKERVATITERAMRGEIAFEPALRERVALLKGLPLSVIDEVIAQRIRLTPGGPTLVATMRAHGAYTCLVSGGFTAFTSKIAATIGFDENHANTLEADAHGNLTGTVAEPILGRDAKLATLKTLAARLGLAPEATLAVGDGANDIPMITAAGLGVAYHAKPAVKDAAGARIDHGDLTALLYAQGYRREEFVERG
jgi:phosphoserine phosphatase